MTGGEDCFLFIGEPIAWLGLEQDSYSSADLAELSETMARVADKLHPAGFFQAPALHLQFIEQY